MQALSDLRVLDLASEVAGPFCGKMLRDFGAAVLKVEPPGGESGRSLPPLIEGAEGPERSAFFAYLNAGKRGLTLDLATPAGAGVFRRLVADADVVIESFRPGRLAELDLDYAALAARHPSLILTSITPFGQQGEWRDRPLDDLTAYALSGWASVNGRPEREPLKGSGYQASFQAGIAAFIATLGAVLHRDRGGAGQQVDIALIDPVTASFAPGILTAQYNGTPGTRRPEGFQSGPVPAADGYFSLTLSRAHFWRDAMNELGLPDLAADSRYYESGYRQQHAAEIGARVEERIAARGRHELFEVLSALRVVSGMVLNTAELTEDVQLRERGFFVEQQHPLAGSLRTPGAPFRMSATPWESPGRAPLLGEHTDAVLSAAGFDAAAIARLRWDGVV